MNSNDDQVTKGAKVHEEAQVYRFHQHSLPSYVPPDLYYVPTDHNPTPLIRTCPSTPWMYFPSHWRFIESHGAWPFTTHVTHETPITHTFMLWDMRKQRKQVEQYTDCSQSTAPRLAETRRVHEMPWYRRMLTFYPYRAQYWSVLFWNFGSHCLLYAAVASFTSWAIENSYEYQFNIGWTIFGGACCWLFSSCVDLLTLMFQRNRGKWYIDERERNIWPGQACESCMTKTEKRVEEQADHPEARHPKQTYQESSSIPPPPLFNFFYRLDYWICFLNIFASILFCISTAANSNYWRLTQAQLDGLVYFLFIVSTVIYLISHYLQIVEVTHNWSPLPLPPVTYHNTFSRKDYPNVTISFLGIVALFAHSISLPIRPVLPPTYDSPWPVADSITLVISATLLTIGHFMEFIEQGELVYTDRDTERMWLKQQIEKQEKDKNNQGEDQYQVPKLNVPYSISVNDRIKQEEWQKNVNTRAAGDKIEPETQTIPDKEDERHYVDIPTQ